MVEARTIKSQLAEKVSCRRSCRNLERGERFNMATPDEIKLLRALLRASWREVFYDFRFVITRSDRSATLVRAPTAQPQF
jgi:hypothetical protein